MTDLSRASDEELFRLSARGDEAAFTALYRRRHPSVYRFALHMSGRPDLAEEVTQDVFLALIREPSCYDAGKGALGSFLIGVARNCVLRHIERDRRHVYVEDTAAYDAEADGCDALADLSREEAIETVRHAVLTLPAAYREAVVLCDLEEMPYAGAAEVIGVPVGTVRSRLNRGRGLLLEKLRGLKAASAATVRCAT